MGNLPNLAVNSEPIPCLPEFVDTFPPVCLQEHFEVEVPLVLLLNDVRNGLDRLHQLVLYLPVYLPLLQEHLRVQLFIMILGRQPDIRKVEFKALYIVWYIQLQKLLWDVVRNYLIQYPLP